MREYVQNAIRLLKREQKALRRRPSVAKNVPNGHRWDRFTITDVGGREVNRQQVTLAFDNRMEFEAIGPPHAALAARGYPGKGSVATDAPIMAYSERLSPVFTPVQAPNPADAEQPRSTPSPSRR